MAALTPSSQDRATVRAQVERHRRQQLLMLLEELPGGDGHKALFLALQCNSIEQCLEAHEAELGDLATLDGTRVEAWAVAVRAALVAGGSSPADIAQWLPAGGTAGAAATLRMVRRLRDERAAAEQGASALRVQLLSDATKARADAAAGASGTGAKRARPDETAAERPEVTYQRLVGQIAMQNNGQAAEARQQPPMDCTLAIHRTASAGPNATLPPLTAVSPFWASVADDPWAESRSAIQEHFATLTVSAAWSAAYALSGAVRPGYEFGHMVHSEADRLCRDWADDNSPAYVGAKLAVAREASAEFSRATNLDAAKCSSQMAGEYAFKLWNAWRDLVPRVTLTQAMQSVMAQQYELPARRENPNTATALKKAEKAAAATAAVATPPGRGKGGKGGKGKGHGQWWTGEPANGGDYGHVAYGGSAHYANPAYGGVGAGHDPYAPAAPTAWPPAWAHAPAPAPPAMTAHDLATALLGGLTPSAGSPPPSWPPHPAAPPAWPPSPAAPPAPASWGSPGPPGKGKGKTAYAAPKGKGKGSPAGPPGGYQQCPTHGGSLNSYYGCTEVAMGRPCTRDYCGYSHQPAVVEAKRQEWVAEGWDPSTWGGA